MYEDFRRDPRGELDWPMGDRTMDKSGLWVLGTAECDDASETHARELTDALLGRNPFLEYAAKFWGRHARGGPEEHLQDKILHFFQNAAALANSVRATYNDEEGLYCRLFFDRHLLGRQVPLFVATYFGMERTVEKLLAIPSIASCDGIDQSVLVWAINCRQEKVARLLIESGADVRGIFNGLSVLRSAIAKNFYSITEELLREYGATLIGPSELRAAVRLDCAYVVQVYLQAAPDLGSKKTRCNELLSMVATPAILNYEGLIASIAGRDSYRPDRILDLLLAEGADTEATDHLGRTILQKCIECCRDSSGGIYLIQRLLDFHANIAVLNTDGQSVVHLAAIFEYGDVITVLLQNGQGILDINAYDKRGMTALHYTTAAGDADSTLALLSAGADVTVRNTENQSVLHLAAGSHIKCRIKAESALAVLLDLAPPNMDVNVSCSRGARPLHYAAEQRDLEAMRLLVLSGADLKAEDSTGLSGLDLSACMVPLVQQALEKGQNVVSIIHEDRTLWHLLTLMHVRSKIIKRIGDLTPQETKDRQYCLQHLREIDQRLDHEFAGYDITEYIATAQQMAQEQDFDYALLKKYTLSQESIRLQLTKQSQIQSRYAHVQNMLSRNVMMW